MAEIIKSDRMNIRVTVIVPCYNMERKIHRMLNSLLAQTAKCFVVYVIDDGSKDNSKEVILSYIHKFKATGVDLNYIFQQNAGVSEAINNGLNRVDTDFFCLPDADDYLEPTYIKECVDYLDNHDDCGIVFTKCNVFHESLLKLPVGVLQRKDEFKCSGDSLCKDFIWGNNVYYCPDYMIRTRSFIEANGNLEIESGRYGQNYQMLLPIVYYSKCGYINKKLYNYIIYKQSISHGKRTLQQYYDSFDGGTNTLHETLKKMSLSLECGKIFHHIVDQKNVIQKADKAFEFGNKSLFEHFYHMIDNYYLPLGIKRLYTQRNNVLCFWGCYVVRQFEIWLKSRSVVFRARAYYLKYLLG